MCFHLLFALFGNFFVPGIIASKRCNHVKIFKNTVSNGGTKAAGIFLHRSTDSAEVYGECLPHRE